MPSFHRAVWSKGVASAGCITLKAGSKLHLSCRIEIQRQPTAKRFTHSASALARHRTARHRPGPSNLRPNNSPLVIALHNLIAHRLATRTREFILGLSILNSTTTCSPPSLTLRDCWKRNWYVARINAGTPYPYRICSLDLQRIHRFKPADPDRFRARICWHFLWK